MVVVAADVRDYYYCRNDFVKTLRNNPIDNYSVVFSPHYWDHSAITYFTMNEYLIIKIDYLEKMVYLYFNIKLIVWLTFLFEKVLDLGKTMHLTHCFNDLFIAVYYP